MRSARHHEAGGSTAQTGEVRYLVLADSALPYLLARVRWPDVAQAITAACPDWLDDPGLFDLAHSPNAVEVSFPQAAALAAGWGRQLRAESAGGAPSFIRRMPANWSDLAPAERQVWGLAGIGRRRVPRLRLRRLRAAQGRWPTPSPAAGEGGGHNTVEPEAAARGVEVERRGRVRVRVHGRVHISSRHGTTSASLVDLSEGGLRCVLPATPGPLVPGATLEGPFVLEAEVATSRVCFAASGRVTWMDHTTAGTHLGIDFGRLAQPETLGVQRFLVAAGTRRGSR